MVDARLIGRKTCEVAGSGTPGARNRDASLSLADATAVGLFAIELSPRMMLNIASPLGAVVRFS